MNYTSLCLSPPQTSNGWVLQPSKEIVWHWTSSCIFYAQCYMQSYIILWISLNGLLHKSLFGLFHSPISRYPINSTERHIIFKKYYFLDNLLLRLMSCDRLLDVPRIGKFSSLLCCHLVPHIKLQIHIIHTVNYSTSFIEYNVLYQTKCTQKTSARSRWDSTWWGLVPGSGFLTPCTSYWPIYLRFLVCMIILIDKTLFIIWIMEKLRRKKQNLRISE